jgi:hypothetical protein
MRTEKIVQLNRPVENNLMSQVEYLTNMLYSQLGLTPEVMNGTADEKAMLNYTRARSSRCWTPSSRPCVEPSSRRPRARRASRSCIFRDPFKFVPIGGDGGIADIADKFSRNEIVSSNEIRQAIGMKPRPEPKADALINSNMPQGDTGVPLPPVTQGDVVDSTAVEVPDPALEQLNSDLASSTDEINQALAAG